MITRNRLIALFVLLTGLTTGYFASRVVHRQQELSFLNLPVFYSEEEIPDPSTANLSIVYEHSKEHFKEMLNQGSDAIREAARRRNVLIQARDRVREDQAAYDRLILQSEKAVDLLRLQDYYSQFYLHYYRWLDTDDAQSAVQYRLSLGQFKATLDYILDKQQDDPTLSVREVEDLHKAIGIAEQSNRTIRWARVVVVVLLFLLVMGIPRLIRDSGHKRFAGALYFNAIFRPNLISTLNRWHSMRQIALVLLVIYFFSLVIFSSFISWSIPLVFGVLGLIPILVLMGFTGKRGKLSALLVSFMAPKMLLLIMVLGVVAVRGPNFLWCRIWGDELFETIFFALLFMLVFRKFHVNIILARKWSHRNRVGSAAMVFMATGLQLLLAGTLLYCLGPEEVLASLNRQLLLMPAFLLEFPLLKLKWVMMGAGIVSAASLSIFIFNRNRLHEPTSLI